MATAAKPSLTVLAAPDRWRHPQPVGRANTHLLQCAKTFPDGRRCRHTKNPTAGEPVPTNSLWYCKQHLKDGASDVPWPTDADDITEFLDSIDPPAADAHRNFGWMAGVLDSALGGQLDVGGASTEELVEIIQECDATGLIEPETARVCLEIVNPTAKLDADIADDMARLEDALDARNAGNPEPWEQLIRSGEVTPIISSAPLDDQLTSPRTWQWASNTVSTALVEHIGFNPVAEGYRHTTVAAVRYCWVNHLIDTPTARQCLEVFDPSAELGAHSERGTIPRCEQPESYTVIDDHGGIYTVIASDVDAAVAQVYHLNLAYERYEEFYPYEPEAPVELTNVNLFPFVERHVTRAGLAHPLSGDSLTVWVHDHRYSRPSSELRS